MPSLFGRDIPLVKWVVVILGTIHIVYMPSMREVETPLNVCLTGAGGQIAYALLPSILNGAIFGQRPINLSLLDVEAAMGILKGAIMELEDCNFSLLNEIIMTDQAEEAFKDCDVAILVGAMPRKEGMERKDLLRANAKIFKVQGEALDKAARKGVKVLVVGNPANTNAFIVSHYAPSIPRENFSALTRLDENRAQSLLAKKLGKQVTQIKNVIVWGNHSNTQYPDISHSKIEGRLVDARDLVGREWYENVFIKTVQTRGAAVIAARKLSSAMSAAKAISDHLTTWLNGTPVGEHSSMAIASEGSYGIPKGIFYSFPVTCHNATWAIVPDLSIDQFSREMMDKTAAELVAERAEALEFLS